MKTTVILIFISGVIRVAIGALTNVRIVVRQQLTSKRTPGEELEVFGTRRLAFLKKDGDVFRLHRPGLSGALGTVSIESARLPGYFLKQHGYKFRMVEEERDDFNSFGKLSTYVERNRADAPDSKFFELVDRPGWFICHEEHPKLILRAREISRTSYFISRCGFFIKREPNLRRKENISKLPQKAKLNKGIIERLHTQISKTGSKEQLNTASRLKQTSPESKAETQSIASIKRGGTVSAGLKRMKKPKTAKLNSNSLATQGVSRLFNGGIPVAYHTTNDGISKALLLKTEEEPTTRFRPGTVSKKQTTKEVIGTKKESGIGLPIVFTKHSSGDQEGRARSQEISNKTNLPTAEILDPSASAIDSDSILALHTDNIIHELEKGELAGEQQQSNPVNLSDDVDNLLDAKVESPVDEDQAEGLQKAIHYEHGGHRIADVTPISSEIQGLQVVKESHQIRLTGHEDEEDSQKLMHRLVDYEKDKCLSILFINKIGNRYKLVSSFNPHGYLPKGVQFSLKAIFKNYGNRKKVIFQATDPYDDDRLVLLNGEKDLLVTPRHCQDASQVVEVTSPSDSNKMALDDNLAS